MKTMRVMKLVENLAHEVIKNSLVAMTTMWNK